MAASMSAIYRYFQELFLDLIASHEAMRDLVGLLSTLVDVKGKILVPGVYDSVAELTVKEKALYDDIDFDMEDYRADIGHNKLLHDNKPDLLMHRWRYPSLSIHGIEGAFYEPGAKTVIPRKVIGKFSVRLVPNQNPKEIENLVVDYLNKKHAESGSPNDMKASCHHSAKPWVSDFNHPHYMAGRKAIRTVFGIEPDMTRDGCSIPVTLTFQEATGKNIMLLPVGACDDGAHSQNEKINRSNYINGMANVLPPFPTFAVHEDNTSIGPRWKKWFKRFEMYLAAHDIKDPTRKRALLLYSAGEEVSDIFETLPDQGEDKDYKAAVAALNVYFQPKVNKTYEVYMFRNATQDSGESLDSYYTRLRRLAQTCEFTNEEEEIKSHIILSCSSTRLRRRALREDMNLKALLDYGRGFEMSERQAKGIEEHEKLCKATEVQMVKPRNVRTKTDQKQCYRCGGNYPHQGRPCPALHETCRNCQKVGHFAKVCKSKSTSKRVNATKEKESDDQSDDSTDEEYTYRVTLHSLQDKGHPVSEVTIGNKTVKCLIDSGAGVNVIDSHTYNKLNIPLSPTSKKIYSYQAVKPLPVLGKFEANVISAVTNTSNIAQFYVVDGADGNLLGYKTATDLRLLHIVNTLSTPKGTSIMDEYSDCFKGLGKMKDKTTKLHIDSSVKPLAQRHRRVPFHMRDQVEAELKNLQDLDIIERAEGPTPWVSPIVIVPKKVGIRICVDMRAANEAIERERHPVPTVEDLIVDLNGSTVFSKIDLNQGYHQLELDADSRNITTFATHLGLFRYKRLSFGINSASEIFQKAIEEAVQGIQGARNISDDIIVFGKQQDDHDNALRAVLQRMRDNNLTANPDKCLFNQSSIDFFGHHFSAEGISADDKKISSLINSSPPKNANEARSFLGFAQYLARFIKDFASISAPIRQLTHKDAKWVWGPDQQHAFASLKASMAAPEVMKYFDPLLKTELIVDASPVGLGAILAQVTHDQGRNVVAYASRSLTDCESRYSQTEREALAVVWGTEHFHLYLHGSSFQAITDHKPLETIFNKSTCKATARLERLQLRLQPYKITVVYRPGADNPADYMSRHPDPKHSTSPNHLSRVDSYVNFVTANAVPNAVTLQEIQDATAKDHTLQNLAKVIATQRWYEAGRDVCEYQQVKQELTVANGVILRGTRIIVPETLRQRMIMLAHSGHQGIVKTKRLLRDSVWFPGIDGMVEEMIKQCLPCQAANHNSSPACEPLKMSPLPQGPWQELSIDFCGPFPNGDYLLVVVDDFSRFPEVEILRSTSAKAVIPHLDSIFARQGIPDVVRTDNGPPFNSENFQMFATHLGFNHLLTTLLMVILTSI
ncbi:hypothetical protein QZH41_002099 [Actinostola sp. cb2023]|nr:hypothetical protein QZH41_002099 [Actinostola sp. cb2023]